MLIAASLLELAAALAGTQAAPAEAVAAVPVAAAPVAMAAPEPPVAPEPPAEERRLPEEPQFAGSTEATTFADAEPAMADEPVVAEQHGTSAPRDPVAATAAAVEFAPTAAPADMAVAAAPPVQLAALLPQDRGPAAPAPAPPAFLTAAPPPDRPAVRVQLAAAAQDAAAAAPPEPPAAGAEPAPVTTNAAQPGFSDAAVGPLAAPGAEAAPAAAPAETAAAAPPAPVAAEPGSAEDADEALLPGRRRPGAPQAVLPERVTQDNAGGVRAPPPEAFPTDEFPVPDRWRIVQTLCPQKSAYANIAAVCGSILDPYHQNFLKGDRPIDPKHKPFFLPITGDDWFLNVSATSDTVVEPRSFPTPVGVQTTNRPGSLDTFGRANSFVAAQTFIGSVSLIKGSTAYKPPEIEYRLTLAYQENYAKVNERRILFVEPSRKPHRLDGFVGVQEAFIDKHLRNVSDRYDFDSVRVGIQPFQADFRGFLFNDNQLGIRFFGNRDDNRFQYNLAGFWRLEKDTNSGLNIVTERPRDDVVLFANLYRQDFPFPGLTTQVSATLNFNREKDNPRVDDNGFPARPALLGTLRGRNYDVAYLGLSTDGRIGRINVTTVAYAALGTDRNNFFNDEKSRIRAYFGAAEASYDVSWIRFRLSALYASGDKKAYDRTEGGFDAIFENPIFAGADTSYYIRQSVPFAGGGRAVALSQRNGILNDLRSSKEEGQSNFNNPGTVLVGAGADFDFTPDFRVSGNVNHLWFANTAVLQALRVEGSIPRDIGWDLSAAAIYRPHFNQNIVFRLSGAVLDPDKGFADLFGNSQGDRRYYSVLFNTILTF